jgi:iron complex transport system substrate-binding protein
MKIVSLLPSATEIVCALGLEKALVAITHECDFPKSISRLPAITASRISHETMTSREIDHAVRSQLDGHGSIYDLDVELLEKLKPDIILTQELCDVCAVSYKQVERAAKIYVADATVVSLEPNAIEDVFKTIKVVGEVTGVPEKATEVIADLKDRLCKIRQLVDQKIAASSDLSISGSKKPSVFMLEWLEPPFSPGHWVPEQVDLAGGKPLLGLAGERSVTTTYEAIQASQPDVLVLIPCGYYIADTLRQLENTLFPASWNAIPAVENNEIWALDATSYFSRPGPRLVDGVEILAKIFHPTIFGKPTATEAVRIDRSRLRFSQAAAI